MKNKLFKRRNLCLTLLIALLPILTVKADKICNTYKNYYFFIEINEATGDTAPYIDKIEQGWKREHRTYFPALSINKSAINKEGIICLKRDENDTESCTSDIAHIDTMTLNEFYTLYVDALNKGQKLQFKINNTEDTTSSRLYTVTASDNVINNYYTHGKWYIISNNTVEEGGESVDLSSSNVNDMTKASLMPDLLEITISLNDSFESLSSNVHRTIKNNKGNDAISTFDVAWKVGSTPKTSVLSPALYYIEYQTCEDKYNATITYYLEDDEGTKTEITKENNLQFDDGNTSPYYKTQLSDGYTEEVESPALKNCTPDKKNVSVKIEGKDFYDEVVYSCKNETIIDNPNTGKALIYIAWIIGLGALGYSVYYFTKLKKDKKYE